jgi:hypothetical protein
MGELLNSWTTQLRIGSFQRLQISQRIICAGVLKELAYILSSVIDMISFALGISCLCK